MVAQTLGRAGQTITTSAVLRSRGKLTPISPCCCTVWVKQCRRRRHRVNGCRRIHKGKRVAVEISTGCESKVGCRTEDGRQGTCRRKMRSI